MSTSAGKKSSWWSKLLKYGLPLAISVGLCYVLFHDMDFGEMAAFIRRDCDFTLIFISMGIGVFGFLFRAARWRIQLRAAQVPVPLMPVVYSIVGTYAVNLILPRFGELWRCEYISRRQAKPFATVLGSLVAERLADTVTVFLIALATVLLGGEVIFSYFDSADVSGGGLSRLFASPWTYAVAAAVVAATVFVWLRYRHSRWVQKIVMQIRHLASGFTSIFHMKGAGWWLLFTLLLWGSYIAQLYLCFEAFGLTRALDARYGFIIVMVCFTLGSISMGVPSNGGIGPYQFALVCGLKCFDAAINETAAYSFANVVLGSQTLVIILCGIAAFILIALDGRRTTR